ncbi:MAG: ferric reductase-like transmembrane domain-containing protein [Brevefilum sp.]
MKKNTQIYLWLVVYILMVFLPLALLIVLPKPAGREFLREVSVAVGFLAMALLGLQTIPSSRIKFFTRAFPMETLYNIHHKLSIFTFIVVLAHPILLFIQNPNSLSLLNLITTPGWVRFGIISILSMFVLVITSVWREVMKIKYDVWRWIHDGLAFLAIGLGISHMFKANHYTALPYQRVLWLTLLTIWVLIILYMRLIRPIIMLKRPYVVEKVVKERGDSWSLYVKPLNHQGFDFSAGQFAWITLESPFIFQENPFSISTSSDREDGVIGFTIKELGDFTSTIKNLTPGDKVYIDGPYGNFNLDDHYDRNLVLIAGGIGSAPVLSILRTMKDRGRKKPVMFFYGNPTLDSVIYYEELEELQNAIDLKVVHALEYPPEAWEGEVGFITADILKRHLPEDYKEWRYLFFLCGPMPMIQAVEGALKGLGIPSVNISSEKYEMA